MPGVVAMLSLVSLTVACAVAAERLRVLRERPFVCGLLFGGLSAIAPFLPVVRVGSGGIPVSLCAVPPIVAGFFFGPVAGLVSGCLACLAGVFSAFFATSALLAVCNGLGTAAAALYAVVIGKWVFCGRRPPLCTAVIAAAYGVIVYFAVGSLFGLDDLPTALEIILAALGPLSAGACLSCGLVVACCGTWRGWWRGCFSSLNLAFVFAGLAVAVTSTVIALNARDEGRAIVRHAVLDLTAEMENQARYMLHESAVNIAESMSKGDRLPTREDLIRYGAVFGVDGISVADTNGLVLATTEGGVSPGESLERDPHVLRRYLGLCDGSAATGDAEPRFFSRPYLPADVQTNDWVKHFGYPLPRVGVLRLAYLWSKFQYKFPQYIKPALEERRIGETGFYLIFNDRGRLELALPGRPETKGLSYAEVGLDAKDLARPYGVVFRVRILGVLCRCEMFEPIGGYRIFAALPLAETQGPALVISTLVALVLLAVCIAFRVVQVRFGQAQEKIDALRAERDRQRTADLELARDIQLAELRRDGTEGDGYRIQTLMNAAREVGGDFYDYYELPDGRLTVTVADVSGKGIPAAFFMMKSRVTLKSCVFSSATPVEAVAKANGRLAENNPADMFVTAWMGILDRSSGVMEFVSAGHNPPLVRRAGGAVEWLQAPRSPAMGTFAGARYRSDRVTLEAGDRLFLYTDGVTEAMNGRGELFGNGRLEAAVAAAGGPLVPAVRNAVRDFVSGAEQADDITMLELEVT